MRRRGDDARAVKTIEERATKEKSVVVKRRAKNEDRVVDGVRDVPWP